MCVTRLTNPFHTPPTAYSGDVKRVCVGADYGWCLSGWAARGEDGGETWTDRLWKAKHNRFIRQFSISLGLGKDGKDGLDLFYSLLM